MQWLVGTLDPSGHCPSGPLGGAETGQARTGPSSQGTANIHIPFVSLKFWDSLAWISQLSLYDYVVDFRRPLGPQMRHLVVGQSVPPSAELVLLSNSFVFFFVILAP